MKPTVGQVLGPLRIQSVSAEQMKDWAQVLRDPNPIHLDPAAVKAKGLGDRVINQGPANLSYIMAMLQTALPRVRIRSLEVKYLDNVFGGDSVQAGAKVVEVSPGDPTRVICEVWLNVEDRGPAIQGSAVLELGS